MYLRPRQCPAWPSPEGQRRGARLCGTAGSTKEGDGRFSSLHRKVCGGASNSAARAVPPVSVGAGVHSVKRHCHPEGSLGAPHTRCSSSWCKRAADQRQREGSSPGWGRVPRPRGEGSSLRCRSPRQLSWRRRRRGQHQAAGPPLGCCPPPPAPWPHLVESIHAANVLDIQVASHKGHVDADLQPTRVCAACRAGWCGTEGGEVRSRVTRGHAPPPLPRAAQQVAQPACSLPGASPRARLTITCSCAFTP